MSTEDRTSPTSHQERDAETSHQERDAEEIMRNEGEGSQQGARDYNRAAHEHARDGDRVSQQARAAARDLDGDEAQTLRRAEGDGKRGPDSEKVIRVTAGHAGWTVEPCDRVTTVACFDHLEDAERHAKRLADEAGAMVLVHDSDGSLIDRFEGSAHR